MHPSRDLMLNLEAVPGPVQLSFERLRRFRICWDRNARQPYTCSRVPANSSRGWAQHSISA
eukprot:3896088-Alexandrium_andersonii.AAC.1